MPELSRFYGIVIKMYFDDHPPPHFHAEYGEYEAVFSVETLAIIAGTLPPRATGMVGEWDATDRVSVDSRRPVALVRSRGPGTDDASVV